jgi:predicted nucleic acid-binding Zn ribbon protein
MKKSNAQPLKEVLQEYVNALKINQKLKEVSLVTSWENIVGRTITKATKDIYIKDRKLFVVLNSSVIRHELTLIKEPLISRLNEEVKANVISDIVFI